MLRPLMIMLAAMQALGSNCITVAAERDQGHSQQLQQSPLERYIAALKKCDAMTGRTKVQCVEAINRKFSYM